MILNKDYAWSLFDGAYQGPEHFCSLGIVLFTAKDQKFTSKAYMVIGIKNQAETRTLFFLLQWATKKNILQLQDFGDSDMAIERMNNHIQVHSLRLSQLGIHLEDTSGHYQMISFTYI